MKEDMQENTAWITERWLTCLSWDVHLSIYAVQCSTEHWRWRCCSFFTSCFFSERLENSASRPFTCFSFSFWDFVGAEEIPSGSSENSAGGRLCTRRWDLPSQPGGWNWQPNPCVFGCWKAWVPFRVSIRHSGPRVCNIWSNLLIQCCNETICSYIVVSWNYSSKSGNYTITTLSWINFLQYFCRLKMSNHPLSIWNVE